MLNVTGSRLLSVSSVGLHALGTALPAARLSPMASCTIQSGRTDINIKCGPISNLTSSLSSGFQILFSTSDPGNFVVYTVSGISTSASSSTLSLNIGPSPSPSATPDFSVNRSGTSHFVQVGGSPLSTGSLFPKLYVEGSGGINSASTSLKVTSSSSASLFQIKDDGTIALGDPYNPNTIDFYGPVSIPSPSSFRVQGNVSLTGTFTYTPSPSPSPLKGISRLSIAQSSSDATVALTSSSQLAAGNFALRVEASPSPVTPPALAASPSPLFLIGNNGISWIGASPSPPTWPSTDASAGLVVNGSVRLSGSQSSLILSRATGSFYPTDFNDINRKCNGDRKGYLTVDQLKLPCICNGTNWVNALDGSRVCFLHPITNDAECAYSSNPGTYQPAPNPAPSTWPSTPFCKYAVDSAPGRNNHDSWDGDYNSNNWNCPAGWSKYANYRQTKETCCDAAAQCTPGGLYDQGTAGEQACKVNATTDFINRDQLPSCGFKAGANGRTCYADVNYGGCY